MSSNRKRSSTSFRPAASTYCSVRRSKVTPYIQRTHGAHKPITKRKHFDGRVPSDSEIRSLYEDWGEWNFLAYWYDLWLSRR